MSDDRLEPPPREPWIRQPSATAKQVAGDHYRSYPIQPIEFITKNGLSFLAGNVIKYVTRYKDKGGSEDIKKAIHYLELILEFEYPKETK